MATTRRFIGQAACGLALSMATMSLACAGSFVVNPVRATLSPDRPVAALVVRNQGDEPMVIQVSTVQWSQSQDRDTQAPTTEILASPPIFTVPPRHAQTIRVGLRHAPDSQRELTYRLILREVPAAPQAVRSTSGMRIALAFSIPVFVKPGVLVAPRVQWRALQSADGRIEVEARNIGSAHLQVGALTLAVADAGTKVAEEHDPRYVLPDNTRRWTLRPAIPVRHGTELELTATTDAGDLRTRIVLEHGATTSVSTRSPEHP